MDLLKIWCCTEAAMLLHPKRIIQGARSALVVDAAMHCTGAAQNRTADPGCAWMFPPTVSGTACLHVVRMPSVPSYIGMASLRITRAKC